MLPLTWIPNTIGTDPDQDVIEALAKMLGVPSLKVFHLDMKVKLEISSVQALREVLGEFKLSGGYNAFGMGVLKSCTIPQQYLYSNSY